MNINNFCKDIHAANVAKGFDGEIETGTRLMLIVSELSEALEADRKSRFANRKGFDSDMGFAGTILNSAYYNAVFKDSFNTCIKDSFEDEIADAIIRLFDLCGHANIDIDFHIKTKLTYNAIREHKHGNKKY